MSDAGNTVAVILMSQIFLVKNLTNHIAAHYHVNEIEFS